MPARAPDVLHHVYLHSPRFQGNTDGFDPDSCSTAGLRLATQLQILVRNDTEVRGIGRLPQTCVVSYQDHHLQCSPLPSQLAWTAHCEHVLATINGAECAPPPVLSCKPKFALVCRTRHTAARIMMA